ncbi:MAG: hypothetical protein U0Q03_16115 [Acidimicrobiales bacterium]
MTVLDRLEQHLDHLPDQVSGRLHDLADLAGHAGQVAGQMVGHVADQVPAKLPAVLPAALVDHLPLHHRRRSSRRTLVIVAVLALATATGLVLALWRKAGDVDTSRRERDDSAPRPDGARLVDA